MNPSKLTTTSRSPRRKLSPVKPIVLVCAIGFGLGACVDTVDDDYYTAGYVGEPPAAASDEASESSNREDEALKAPAQGESNDRPADRDPDGGATDPNGGEATGVDADADADADAESTGPAEPELAMVADEEISEAEADEPAVEPQPVDVDNSNVEVPQASLGLGESVLCATIQIGFDAVGDGDRTLVSQQRRRLIDGLDSIEDVSLAEILSEVSADATLDRDVLDQALRRCEALGYEG